MTLSDATEGQTVTVDAVSGSPILRKRFLELGLTPGTKIKVERFAPLRDPIQIRVRGTSLALRVAEGRHITVSAAAQ